MSIEIEYISVKKNYAINIMLKKIIKQVIKTWGYQYKYHVFITICNNEHIKEINYQYRQIENATDVLSFPMISWSKPMNLGDINEIENINFDTDELEIGDILISIDRAKAQAIEYGHSIKRELGYLCIHGMLHLLGHDHIDDKDKTVMRQLEEKILLSLNITR